MRLQHFTQTITNKMKNILLLLFCFCSVGVFAQSTSVPTPGKAQAKPIFITNATIHTATGEVIENGIIGFDKGKITAISSKMTVPQDAEVIDAQGKHVYPGFISPQSILGLVEVDAVRATRDNREVGKMNPHIRSIIAYNTDSHVTPTVRSNGVLMAQIIPQGGRIAGTSSVVQLDAWNYEDATIKENDGIQVNWPSVITRSGWWAEPGGLKPNDKYETAITELETFFAEAEAYCMQKQTAENLIFEAMCGVFDKTKNVYVSANHIKEIESVIAFAKAQDIKVTVCGGRDAWLLAKELKEANISVILDPSHELPFRTDDDVDLPFKMPKILKDAGVNYAVTASNGYGDQRNLPFHASKAVAYGLTPEEALQSITKNTAEILGVADKVGTLEVGKDATLFMSTGDVFDIMTSHIEVAFIQGRKVDLDNKQKALYRKFQGKYDGEVKQH